MHEYISREAANDTINETAYEYEDDKALTALYHAADRLNDLPAADVVEVVRCYECKYWEHRPDRQYDLCAYLFGAKRSCNPEDFCSRGKRKGGQDDV